MGEGDVVGDEFKYSTGLTTSGKELQGDFLAEGRKAALGPGPPPAKLPRWEMTRFSPGGARVNIEWLF